MSTPEIRLVYDGPHVKNVLLLRAGEAVIDLTEFLEIVEIRRVVKIAERPQVELHVRATLVEVVE